MQIRRAAPADADSVADAFLGAKAEMTYLPVLHIDAETRHWIADHVLRNVEVWVAENDGRVVGFAVLGDDFLEDLVHPIAQNHV